MWKLLLVVILMCVLRSYAIFYNFILQEGSSCMTARGRHGQCAKAIDCYGSNAFPFGKMICYFDGEHIIVCCSERRLHRMLKSSITANTEERVSQKKFQEYMESIFGKNNDTEQNEPLERIPTLPGEYPHMSAIGYRDDSGEIDYKCGGSLISPNFVMTAAHCSQVKNQAPYTVRIGDLNLLVNETTVHPQDFLVRRVYIHPNYTDDLYYNDIGLVELDRSVVFTEFVYPACVWATEIVPNEVAVAMGYGSSEFGGRLPNLLTEMELTIVGNIDCNRSMPRMETAPEGIIRTQICAIDNRGNRDTCQGDSGGPLQLNTNINGIRYYHIIGITSYGVFCGFIFPGVYTRVSSYIDWIEGIVWPSGR